MPPPLRSGYALAYLSIYCSNRVERKEVASYMICDMNMLYEYLYLYKRKSYDPLKK